MTILDTSPRKLHHSKIARVIWVHKIQCIFMERKNLFFSSGHRFHFFTYIFLQLSKVCQALHPCIMKVSTNISFVNDGYFNIWQWIYVTWLMVLRSTCWYVCLGPGTAHTISKLMFISNSVSTQHHALGLTNCLN